MFDWIHMNVIHHLTKVCFRIDLFSTKWSLEQSAVPVIGFVNAKGGNILSEPVNIFLNKAKSYYDMEILNHFSIMKRLQFFYNLAFQFLFKKTLL